jgi:hypothetical protein
MHGLVLKKVYRFLKFLLPLVRRLDGGSYGFGPCERYGTPTEAKNNNHIREKEEN